VVSVQKVTKNTSSATKNQTKKIPKTSIASVVINANAINIRDAFSILEENGLIRSKDNSSTKRFNNRNAYKRRPPRSNMEN